MGRNEGEVAERATKFLHLIAKLDLLPIYIYIYVYVCIYEGVVCVCTLGSLTCL